MKLHKSLLLFGASALLLVACAEKPVEETEASGSEVEEVSTEDLINQAIEKSTGSYEEVQEPQELERQTFDINEIMIVSDETGPLLEVTVTSVTDRKDELPSYLQGSDYYNSDNLIIINVHYKNVGMSENVSVGLWDFQVYGEDGTLIETISQQSGGEDVSKGRSATSQFYVEYTTPQDTVELDFISDGQTLGTVIAPVEH